MNKFVKSTLSIIMCLCMLIPSLAFFSSAATVGQVKNLKATANTSSSITLEWDKVSGARGYKVYSYDSSQKKWVREKTTAKTTFTVSSLTSAKSYKFRVRAYKGTDSITYGAYSATLTTATAPAQVKGLTASGNTTSALTLSWKAVKRATGYRAYVFDSKTSTWKKMGTTTATSCKVSGLTA
ncbi:MAG: fibronectin type III domain-containing protein, partial [Acutalibacteraceae bacterium]